MLFPRYSGPKFKSTIRPFPKGGAPGPGRHSDDQPQVLAFGVHGNLDVPFQKRVKQLLFFL